MWGKICNSHDAEELVSAVFLKIVKKADSYALARPPCPLGCTPSPATGVTDYFRTHRTMVLFEDYMVGEEISTDLTDAQSARCFTPNNGNFHYTTQNAIIYICML